MIRVVLPRHLRTLAKIDDAEVLLDVAPPVTQHRILDTLEARFPVLRGTIRNHGSDRRRPLIRFYACDEDHSHDPPDATLPDEVSSGEEPFFIVGAIAGG